MNRAAIRRLIRHLNPPGSGITRKLVACLETSEGVLCHECGAVHATVEEFEQLHGGPGIGVIVERVVGADRQPISGTSPD